MSTLPDPGRAQVSDWPLWKTCEVCGELFPGAAGQDRCRGCEPVAPDRCEAARPDDRWPCQGQREAVRIVDRAGGQAYGCLRHAPVMLASIAHARVYPGAVPGAAVVVYREAARLRLLQFDHRAGGGR